MTTKKTSEQTRMRGAVAHHGGAAAELGVAEAYRRRGLEVVARRWRGAAGEIDLIAQDGAAFVLVEVKRGRDFDRAAQRLGPRQVARLRAAAEEFAGTCPDGLLTEMRFDVALVDGSGGVRILENALAGD